MNQSAHTRRFMGSSIWLLVCTLLTTSCQDHQPPLAPGATSYSADVVTSWLTMQLKLTQTTLVSPAFPPRRFAYTGIALYESIVPGLAAYQSIAPQLNGLPALPTITPNVSYYWPACANAAAGAMCRSFFPTTSAVNKASIDSLEAANAALYQKDRPADELTRSAEFGRKIAATVSDWSKSDGYDDATPNTLPTGPGLWVPTPPAFAPPAFTNWGKGRLIVPNSDAGADQGPPIPYSEDPASMYYIQAKEIYDMSQNLTTEQRTQALFWGDNPDGKSFSGGHSVSILNQVLLAQKPGLEVAAVAFAQLGITISDAQFSLYKVKYKYNTMRPITYIRTVLNQPTWSSLLGTPAHPEYTGGTGVTMGAAAQALTLLFGQNYKFTDNSYNSVGFSPRSYNSFEEAAIESSVSRIYAGLHYRKTGELSLLQGKVIANNVAQKLKFKR